MHQNTIRTYSSPEFYYILSGDDFTLTINDPERPKIVLVTPGKALNTIVGARGCGKTHDAACMAVLQE